MKNRLKLSLSVLLLAGSFAVSHLATATASYNAVDVIGQNKTDGTPVWTTGTANNAGNTIGRNAIDSPYSDVVIDNVHHRLFVSDSNNNRVLIFNLNEDGTLVDHNADYVLGQPDFDTVEAGMAQNKFDYPWGLTYDFVNDHLFVGECGNAARVTVFDTTTITSGENAINVLGQSDFTTNDSPVSKNGFGIGANGCITGLDYDSSHNRLFVSDNGNSRVMIFDTTTITNGMDASYVLGQPDFITSGHNTTQNGLSNPISVVYDSNNRLFVLDNANHRIMVFDITTIINNEDAIYVLGQSDFITSNFSTSQNGLSNYTYGLAYDSNNSFLFVDDSGNNRIMVFDTTEITNGENAINVLGQSDFTTNDSNTTQNGLSEPSGLGYDSISNSLYVTDANNNRIMIFDTTEIVDGENAVDVIGQNKSDGTPVWTTGTANNAGNTVGPNAINDPEGDMAVDTVHHRLFVNDSSNNRVLVFNLNEDGTLVDHNADYVLGQPDFDTVTSGTTQSTFNYPAFLTYDLINNRLFVGDNSNSRVLVFNTTTITNGMDASYVLGQPDFTSSDGTTTQNGLYYPWGLAYDSNNNHLFVADVNNNRIMVFDTSTITNGMNASYVLGQPDFISSTPHTTQNGFNGPSGGLAYDSEHEYLFVGGWSNNRVLVFDTTTITNGMNASYVLGQPDFTSNTSNTTQNGFNGPNGFVFDSLNNRLFVVDYSNNRVMVFDVSEITNGQDAINVLGQSDFTTNTPHTTQDGFNVLSNLGFDQVNNILYVGDGNNNRILIFSLIKLTTSSLPNGETGTAYSQTLASSGSQGTVTYELSSGTLPTGLTLTGNTISGTPTTSGSYTFTIKANDTWTDEPTIEPFSDSKSYTIEITGDDILPTCTDGILNQDETSIDTGGVCTPVVRHTSSGSSPSRPIQQPTTITPPASNTAPTSTLPPLTITKTLKLKSTGEDVKILQTHLNTLGYNTGTPDGSFGPKTLEAIKKFQQDHNLTPDGVVGPKTLALLSPNPVDRQVTPTLTISTTEPSLTPSLLPTTPRTLKQGMRGDDVKQIQSYLSSLGYDIGNTDGILGNKTNQAIIKFQKDNNLTPDGVVGKLTWGRVTGN